MTRLALLLTTIIITSASAFGQEVYVSLRPFQTSGPRSPTTGGALPQVLWVANAAVFVCAHPSASLSACQAALDNHIYRFNRINAMPDFRAACADAGEYLHIEFRRNLQCGILVPRRQIDYWVTSAYGTFGPFTITGGDANPFLCTFTGSQPSTCTGTVKAGFVQGDIATQCVQILRSPRSRSALHFTGNDTPAFNAMFTQGSWIQNPVGFCDLTVPSGTATAGVFNNSSTYNLNDTVPRMGTSLYRSPVSIPASRRGALRLPGQDRHPM